MNRETKKAIKFEKVKDGWGETRGYRLGEYYLMKVYGWNNSYSWIINKTGDYHYSNYEFSMLLADGEVQLVKSCREGKTKLRNLYDASTKGVR